MKFRMDSPRAFTGWQPFPNEAIVVVFNKYGERRVGPAGKFNWSHEYEFGELSESVIMSSYRLDYQRGKT